MAEPTRLCEEGFGAWTALGLVVLGSLAMLGGAIAAVLSWIGALLNTWQLEDKTWFAALLVLGLLGFGVLAMIAYVLGGLYRDGGKRVGRLAVVRVSSGY
jgi:hypothetical protein